MQNFRCSSAKWWVSCVHLKHFVDLVSMCTSNFCIALLDSTSCGIMTVKFIEYLSAGIPFNTIDPAKFGYYRLKLAIEALRGEAYVWGKSPYLTSYQFTVKDCLEICLVIYLLWIMAYVQSCAFSIHFRQLTVCWQLCQGLWIRMPTVVNPTLGYWGFEHRRWSCTCFATGIWFMYGICSEIRLCIIQNLYHVVYEYG